MENSFCVPAAGLRDVDCRTIQEILASNKEDVERKTDKKLVELTLKFFKGKGRMSLVNWYFLKNYESPRSNLKEELKGQVRRYYSKVTPYTNSKRSNTSLMRRTNSAWTLRLYCHGWSLSEEQLWGHSQELCLQVLIFCWEKTFWWSYCYLRVWDQCQWSKSG